MIVRRAGLWALAAAILAAVAGPTAAAETPPTPTHKIPGLGPTLRHWPPWTAQATPSEAPRGPSDEQRLFPWYFSDVFRNGTDNSSSLYSSNPAPAPVVADAGDSCLTLGTATNSCAVARNGCPDASLLQYTALYYCTAPQYHWLVIIFMLLLLLVYFFILSHNSDLYLSTSIQQIADFMNVSDEVTGAVFLSFCNGAPDLFTAIASSESGSYNLILGNVLGAGLFATNIVVGCVVLGSIYHYNTFMQHLAAFNPTFAELLAAKANMPEGTSPLRAGLERVGSGLRRLCGARRVESAPTDTPAPSSEAPVPPWPIVTPPTPLVSPSAPEKMSSVESYEPRVELEGSELADLAELAALGDLQADDASDVNAADVADDHVSVSSSVSARVGIAAVVRARVVRHVIHPFRNVFHAVFRTNIQFRGYAVQPGSYFRNLFVYLVALVSIFLIYQFGVLALWMPALFLAAYACFIASVLGQRWWADLQRRRARERRLRATLRPSASLTASRRANVPTTPRLASSLDRGDSAGPAGNTLWRGISASKLEAAGEAYAMPGHTHGPRILLNVLEYLWTRWRHRFVEEAWYGKPVMLILTPLRLLIRLTNAPALVQLVEDDDDASDDGSAVGDTAARPGGSSRSDSGPASPAPSDPSPTSVALEDINDVIKREMARVEGQVASEDLLAVSTAPPSVMVTSTASPEPEGLPPLPAPLPGITVDDANTLPPPVFSVEARTPSFASVSSEERAFLTFATTPVLPEVPSVSSAAASTRGVASYPIVPLSAGPLNPPPPAALHSSTPSQFLQVPLASSLKGASPGASPSGIGTFGRSASMRSTLSLYRRVSGPRFSKGFVRYVHHLSQLSDLQLALYRTQCVVFPPFACLFAAFATSTLSLAVAPGLPLWLLMLCIGCAMSVALLLLTQSLRPLGAAVRTLVAAVPDTCGATAPQQHPSESGGSVDQKTLGRLSSTLARAPDGFSASSLARTLRASLRRAATTGDDGARTLHASLRRAATMGEDGTRLRPSAAPAGSSMSHAQPSFIDGTLLGASGAGKGTSGRFQTEGQVAEKRVRAMLAWVTVGSNLVRSQSPPPAPLPGPSRLSLSSRNLARPVYESRMQGEFHSPLFTRSVSSPPSPAPPSPSPFLALRSYSVAPPAASASSTDGQSSAVADRVHRVLERLSLRRTPAPSSTRDAPPLPVLTLEEASPPPTASVPALTGLPPVIVISESLEAPRGTASNAGGTTTPDAATSSPQTLSFDAPAPQTGLLNVEPSLRSLTPPSPASGAADAPEMSSVRPSVASTPPAPELGRRPPSLAPTTASLAPLPGPALATDQETDTLPLPVGLGDALRQSMARSVSTHSAVQMYVSYQSIVRPLRRYYYLQAVLNVMTVANCVLWIYVTANEIVGLLLTVSRALGLSEGIIGVTILAWGNTFGDLFADMAMAKAGNFHAALTAAFTGPVMNVFLTVGLTFLIARLRKGSDISLPALPLQQYLTFGFLIFGLLVVSVLVLTLVYHLRMPKSYSLLLLSFYVLFLIVVCTAEGVLH